MRRRRRFANDAAEDIGAADWGSDRDGDSRAAPSERSRGTWWLAGRRLLGRRIPQLRCWACGRRYPHLHFGAELRRLTLEEFWGGDGKEYSSLERKSRCELSVGLWLQLKLRCLLDGGSPSAEYRSNQHCGCAPAPLLAGSGAQRCWDPQQLGPAALGVGERGSQSRKSVQRGAEVPPSGLRPASP